LGLWPRKGQIHTWFETGLWPGKDQIQAQGDVLYRSKGFLPTQLIHNFIYSKRGKIGGEAMESLDMELE
jgi:hypothetical protein